MAPQLRIELLTEELKRNQRGDEPMPGRPQRDRETRIHTRIELCMNQAHQEVSDRQGEKCPLSLRFWWGIGLALAIGIWTPPEAWALTVSPPAMTFQAVQGASNPPSQTLNVSKGNNHPTNWTATDNATWLAVSPGAGNITSTAQIAVAVNTSGLAAGIYSATVTIQLNKGGSALVPVTVIVAPAPPTAPPPPPPPTTPPPPPPPPSTATQVMTMTDASGTWVLWSNQVATLNGKQVSNVATNFRMCNGAVQVQSTDANWYVYTAATQIWALTSATCPVTAPPTSSSTTGTSGTASLTWSPPTNSTGVAGYNVYMGTASGVYGPPINVGNVTSYVVNNLVIGTTYYFVVKDYNSSGVESLPTNEVSKSIY